MPISIQKNQAHRDLQQALANGTGSADEAFEPTTADLVTIAEISIALDRQPPEGKRSRLHQFRAIVDKHSIGKVDGVLVDVQSAHAAVLVYEAVKPAVRAKLDRMPVARLIAACWKAVR